MLELFIPKQEKYNSKENTFVSIEDTVLQLEHSLKSVQKWEAKWKKPFLGKEEKTMDQLVSYISCMTLNDRVDPNVYFFLTYSDIQKTVDYIEDGMTATWFSNDTRIGGSNKSGEVITAEVIYYWMVTFRVPVEFENWHLNQLLTLLKVINIKSGGEKKMSKKEAAMERAMLNKQRRAALKTKG